MKEWFNNLDARERKLISVAAVLLVILLFYVMLWQPFFKEYSRLQQSVVDKEKQVSEMRQLAMQVKQAKAMQPQRAGIADGKSLLGTIDFTAKSNQLADALKRVQPDGDDKARVSLDNANFDKVVRWLENLQRQQGIEILSSSVEKLSEPGMVNVRLLLQGS